MNFSLCCCKLGIGAGSGTAIFAQIAWTTTEQERTGVYSIAMGCRQLGLLIGKNLVTNALFPFCISVYGLFHSFLYFLHIRYTSFDIGPAFNLFLKETNFYVGPYKVDHYTSPGVSK